MCCVSIHDHTSCTAYTDLLHIHIIWYIQTVCGEVVTVHQPLSGLVNLAQTSRVSNVTQAISTIGGQAGVFRNLQTC